MRKSRFYKENINFINLNNFPELKVHPVLQIEIFERKLWVKEIRKFISKKKVTLEQIVNQFGRNPSFWSVELSIKNQSDLSKRLLTIRHLQNIWFFLKNLKMTFPLKIALK